MPTPQGDRRPTVKRWVNGVIVAVFIGLIGLGAAAVLSGRYQVRPVLTGSMRPGLPVGGLVITHRVPISSLRVRDVVVFHRPGMPQDLVVHRIISITPGRSGPVVQTQGDNNNAPDPWKVHLRGTTAYRAVGSLPYLGYASVWVHSTNGREVCILIGLLAVLGAAAGNVAIRRRPAPGPAPTVITLPDAVSPTSSPTTEELEAMLLVEADKTPATSSKA